MRSQTGVKPKRQKHPLFWHAIRDDNGLLERAVARLALYTKTAVAGFLCLPPATLTGMGVVQERKWTRRRAWSAFSTELVVSLFRQHGRAKGRLLRLRQVHGGRTTEHVARRPSYVLDVLERAEHMRERQQEKLDLKRQREATTIANAERRVAVDHYSFDSSKPPFQQTSPATKSGDSCGASTRTCPRPWSCLSFSKNSVS